MAADIRPARATDVDALLAIESAVFETDRLSRASFRRLIASASAAVLVAVSDASIAGYCVVLVRTSSSSARLYSLAAAPGFAGQGIGRALLEAAAAESLRRHKQVLRLEVRHDNRRAIAIYEQAGFRRAAIVSDYYEDGATALRMQMDISPAASADRGKATFGGSVPFSRLNDRNSRRTAS